MCAAVKSWNVIAIVWFGLAIKFAINFLIVECIGAKWNVIVVTAANAQTVYFEHVLAVKRWVWNTLNWRAKSNNRFSMHFQTTQAPCSIEIEPCGNTCQKTLKCGNHICAERCHRNECGQCLEIVAKKCRCGLFTKELPCSKSFSCEAKCKRMKDCNKHVCSRKVSVDWLRLWAHWTFFRISIKNSILFLC